MNFRRYYQPGQIVFITQITYGRQPVFTTTEFSSLLLESWRRTKEHHPYKMLAYVILPDHFHFLIQPSGDDNFSQIMHSLKLNFTLSYKKRIDATGQIKFWQKRFWDHVIRNEQDLENHIHYIHSNPVKHGYVPEPGCWQNSSYSVWQSRGAYPLGNNWHEPESACWGE